MKLHYTDASPYVRKVVVSAIEAGLDDEIERIAPGTNVWIGDGDPGVADDNPLGKVPTLINRDGTILIDSTLICEYLASLAPDAGLLPTGGGERWPVLYLQALAQGFLDAVVFRAFETQIRPDRLRWDDWIARQSVKIARTLDRLEAMLGEDKFSDKTVNLGTITLACVLAYMDQRLNDQAWRDGHPGLSEWYDRFSRRESMQATIPPPLPPPHPDPRKAN